MTPVVIMAGGRGIRLHPLTEERPKPLFNVGGKAILEQIVEGFVAQDYRDIWLSVNYRAELIREHFGDGSRFGARIRYLREDQPLGTAGALGFMRIEDRTIIVQNGDVLTHLRYDALIARHLDMRADATVCLALHQHQIPYGVAQFDGERFIGLKEKPIENVLINAGIYALDAKLVKGIEGYADMPDVIGRARHLAYYPIEESWFDCGSFIDLARANNDWKGKA